MLNRSKILFAPLDWGIGHATRIIPIIKYLSTQNCEIIIAADGQIMTLLKVEFPQTQFIFLKGYNIQYSKNKKWLPLKILLQIPGIIKSIIDEHKWLKKVVKIYGIDGIISDNRFGLFHTTIPCAYITHQLLIKTGNSFLENILQKIHNRFILKFNFCWVPDYQQTPNIAGLLSHPIRNLPTNIKYIGLLSRFNKKSGVTIVFKLLILLSGPEPQRSILENLLISQLIDFDEKVLFVRGLPDQKDLTVSGDFNKNIIFHNHLSAEELNNAILSAEIVICRSGYTTIMDLIKLQKNAILIPTPGQTEQEYLADNLMQQHMFYAVKQADFLLSDALKKANTFNFIVREFDMELFKKPVEEFVKYLHKPNPLLNSFEKN